MGKQTLSAICSAFCLIHHVVVSFSLHLHSNIVRNDVTRRIYFSGRDRKNEYRPRRLFGLFSTPHDSDAIEPNDTKEHAIFQQVATLLHTMHLNEPQQTSSNNCSMKPLYVLENNRRQLQQTPQELNLKIVHGGQKFASFSKKKQADVEKSSLSHGLQSPMTRVSGCVATVHISTTLVPIDGQNTVSIVSPTQYYVQLDGTADALLSQGLVALVSASVSCGNEGGVGSVLEQIFQVKQENCPTAEYILRINPATVADELGLRDTLSRGRNDGVASIVTVVQQQIRSLLNVDESKSEQNSIEYETTNHRVNGDSGGSIVTAREEKRNDSIVKTTKKKKVAVLLSGGVDSSVVLNLLVRDPQYDVHAFYLKIWLEDEMAHLGQCPWEDDWEMCQKVVAQAPAHVPLEAIALQEQYRDQIIQYTIEEAKRGRTPNPDVMCNARVKFGCFYDAISDRDFDFIATGHYAKVVRGDDADASRRADVHRGLSSAVTLHRAPDPVKDQSFFLSALSQEQLSRVLFPIGKYTKKEVRALAHEFDLPNKDRPDSQGLCFLGKIKFDDFLAAYLGENPGDIVDASTGEIIGRHKGLWFHTVGQVSTPFVNSTESD